MEMQDALTAVAASDLAELQIPRFAPFLREGRRNDMVVWIKPRRLRALSRELDAAHGGENQRDLYNFTRDERQRPRINRVRQAKLHAERKPCAAADKNNCHAGQQRTGETRRSKLRESICRNSFDQPACYKCSCRICGQVARRGARKPQ